MRKFLVIVIALSITFPLMAQQRTGNIYGTVVDDEGNPLPGVAVTLSGSLTAPMTAVSNAEGKFRFLSLPPARDYSIRLELSGFKRSVEEGIIVAVGGNVNLIFEMEVGGLEEEVTVTAVTPVVDQKKTSAGQNVSQEVLQSLPTARDPWVILQLVPSIQVDRQNVGGNESGQQTTFVAHGQRNSLDNVWSVDGAMVTDVSSTASPIYYDFDSFEEMNITTGGMDVTQQTGGIGVNLVTRRGGSNLSLGGRIYYTEEYFQGDNLTQELREEGVREVNRIVDIRDYGFNLGGPFVRDKAWWWFSWGVQDIKTMTVLGTSDDSILTNFNGKLNFQLLPQNRIEFYITTAKKEKFGRGASYSTPFGTHQFNFFHFGSPVVKVQDEHMFGDNLFVSGKFTYVNSGFGLAAMYNEDSSEFGFYNMRDRRWDQDFGRSLSSRARYDTEFNAIYFNDGFLGASHEMKLGFYYSERRTWSKSENHPYFRYMYVSPQFDITGDGIKDIVPGLHQLDTNRWSHTGSAITAWAGYFQDTISAGNFNFIFGARFDSQAPWVPSFDVTSELHYTTPDTPTNEDTAWKKHFTPETANVLAQIWPEFTVPEVKPGYSWDVFSPRIGLTWDIAGNGKTIAKFNYGSYGNYMPTGESYIFRPLGYGGWADYWWMDNNGDGICDYTELYWHNKSAPFEPFRVFDDAGNFIGDWDKASGVMWGGFDPQNPKQTSDPSYTVGEDYGSERTQEILTTIEREIRPDLGVALNFTYRIYDKQTWGLDYYPDTGYIRNSGDYVIAGYIPDEVGGYSTEDAAGKPYYLLGPEVEGKTTYTNFTYLGERPDTKDLFWGFDLVLNKRLSNKWMLNTSITFQGQQVDYGNGYLNPTNLWAQDKTVYAPYIGASSGKISQYVFSRWMVKISGLYQLPYGINLSGSFLSREGNIVPETFDIYDSNSPNPNNRSTIVYIKRFGELRLPVFYTLNFRLEKLLNLKDIGRVYLMADLFNALNSSTIIRRYGKDLGTYYPVEDKFVPNKSNFLANEILNPRLFRLGIRFIF